MLVLSSEQLGTGTARAECARCENSGLRRDGCPNCGGTGYMKERVTEASSLGFAPGEWPDRFIVTNDDGTMSSYVLQVRTLEDGTRFYKSPGLPTVVVLND